MISRQCIFSWITLIFVVGCVLIHSFGCSTLNAKPSYCDGVIDSIICDRIPNPQVADIAIQVGSMLAIKEGVYDKIEFLQFLDETKLFLEKVVTYAELYRYLSAKLKIIPPELAVLSENMNVFRGVLVPISLTDRNFFLAHIEHVRLAVSMIEKED